MLHQKNYSWGEGSPLTQWPKVTLPQNSTSTQVLRYQCLTCEGAGIPKLVQNPCTWLSVLPPPSLAWSKVQRTSPRCLLTWRLAQLSTRTLQSTKELDVTQCLTNQSTETPETLTKRLCQELHKTKEITWCVFGNYDFTQTLVRISKWINRLWAVSHKTITHCAVQYNHCMNF